MSTDRDDFDAGMMNEPPFFSAEADGEAGASIFSNMRPCQPLTPESFAGLAKRSLERAEKAWFRWGSEIWDPSWIEGQDRLLSGALVKERLSVATAATPE